MQERTLITTGAITVFIAVAAGAFGAHALKKILSPDLLAVWQTAVQYQSLHGIGLILIGVLQPRLPSKWTARAGCAMLAGTIIFSGSLYALALTGIRWFGAITPIGGVALLAAWAMLAWSARSK